MIHIKQPTFRATPYGDVDTEASETLSNSYDTATLLEAVELIDQLRPLFAKSGDLREALLHLHGMAQTVLSAAPLAAAEDGSDISEAAQHLIDELFDVVAALQSVMETLIPLTTLAPSDETDRR